MNIATGADRRHSMVDAGTVARTLVYPAVKGAVAGCVATGPMTLFMLGVHRVLSNWPRPALPPKKIALSLAQRVGLKKHLDRDQRQGFAWISHFLFGTSMGALYGPLSRRVPGSPLLTGPVYGLMVWATSYLGWLPALDVPGAATDESPRRNLMMIAAHLVWGSTLGAVVHLTRHAGEE
jgi:putative membrane protein